MEVDEIQRQQEVCKFQKINSSDDNNSSKLATQKGNHHYFDEDTTTAVTAAGVCGWPSSRIVRVSRASGGKDRHSKVLTSKGLRDRRVRLSVTTAIQFYDLQDRLGYDQPSKAVEWLIKAASSSISELPSLDPSFSAGDCNETHHFHHRKLQLVGAGDEKYSINETEFEDPNNKTHHQNNSKSSACSSTSETSKGSGVSLSRSENRIRARERAREMAAKKEKEKDNGVSQNSSFTDLLTGGGGGGISSATVSPTAPASPESRIHWTTTTTTTTPMMDYFFNRPPTQMPQQFNITAGENHPQHHFSFLQENFSGDGAGAGGGGESYNLNFSIAPGFNRGTLQSNYYLQRFQSSSSSSMVDGSTSTNFPFFIAPTIGAGATTTPEHFPATGYDSQRLQLYGGADGGRHHSDHRKEKSKN